MKRALCRAGTEACATRGAVKCAVLVLALFVAAGGARAQEATSSTLPLDRFRTPIDDSGLAVTEGGSIPAHLNFQTGLIFNYARNPLVLRDSDGNVAASIVGHRLNADVLFTIGLFDYVSVGVDLPLTLVQAGDDLPGNLKDVVGTSNGLAAIGVGDLKLVPKIRLLREDKHGVSLALIPAFTLPTAGGIRFNDDGPAYEYGGDYLGEGPGALAFLPEVAVSTNIAGFRPAANLAYRLRGSSKFLDTFTIHPEITYRLGLGYELQPLLQLPGTSQLAFVELTGATADRNPFGLVDNSNAEEVRLQNPMELLLGARWGVVENVSVEGGAGAGLRAGYGTPDFRIFLGVRYAPVEHDKDGDGILDKDDACKDVAEDKDGFEDIDGCPDDDNDKDGVKDAADACRDVAEDNDNFEDADGCVDADNDADGVKDDDDSCRDVKGLAAFKGCPPTDADKDGITDDKDACKDVPGVPEKQGCPNDDKDNDGVKDVDDACVASPGPITTKGCPDKDLDGIADSTDRCVDVPGTAEFKGCKDTDADGLADPDDKCPNEAEVINGVEDDDGCPDKGKVLVVVTKEKIELKETVFFDPGKDTIQKRSFSLLDQVALVMKAHPEVKKISIEGHTDSDGADDKNLDLSKRRAAAVLQALTTRGIGPERLTSTGFGEGQPIADNKTKDGKAKNRRVELRIVE